MLDQIYFFLSVLKHQHWHIFISLPIHMKPNFQYFGNIKNMRISEEDIIFMARAFHTFLTALLVLFWFASWIFHILHAIMRFVLFLSRKNKQKTTYLTLAFRNSTRATYMEYVDKKKRIRNWNQCETNLWIKRGIKRHTPTWKDRYSFMKMTHYIYFLCKKHIRCMHYRLLP